MEFELSEITQADIDFLHNMSLEEVISWPIDFETNRQTFSETSDVLDMWLGGKKWRETEHHFIQFGQDGCGSLFCLWYYPELKGEPPVVFLGSEGERALVSNSAHDFVMQITSGKVFYDGSWLDPHDEDKDELNWDLLSKKAKSYLGSLCDNPSELTKSAQAKHPDISSWIESNVE
ncbi:hypothetical protein [Thalassolituus pacificus]|uniref:SMI1/KNR4 family protein n=1 Tax=Thalassolituus pacificus TaxID=2975440 RepID=A0A9X3AE58_9GAMM|nr:hypothetical protein [Thalassolituus pacificus]MCT7357887.1 hypothetical protein [Thalassolituus pacificus]